MTDTEACPEPQCYFCGFSEPTIYVRWSGRAHYAFLCAIHEDEYAEHIAQRYSLDEGITFLRRVYTRHSGA